MNMNVEEVVYHLGLLYLENKTLQRANVELAKKAAESEKKPAEPDHA